LQRLRLPDCAVQGRTIPPLPSPRSACVCGLDAGAGDQTHYEIGTPLRPSSSLFFFSRASGPGNMFDYSRGLSSGSTIEAGRSTAEGAGRSLAREEESPEEENPIGRVMRVMAGFVPKARSSMRSTASDPQALQRPCRSSSIGLQQLPHHHSSFIARPPALGSCPISLQQHEHRQPPAQNGSLPLH